MTVSNQVVEDVTNRLVDAWDCLVGYNEVSVDEMTIILKSSILRTNTKYEHYNPDELISDCMQILGWDWDTLNKKQVTEWLRIIHHAAEKWLTS